MLRGDPVGCTTVEYASKLIGHASSVKCGDYSGHIAIQPGDPITVDTLSKVERLGVLGEFYSECLARERRGQVNIFWREYEDSAELLGAA